MTEPITPSAFHAAHGTGDWRVVGDGAGAFFRTPTLADAARLIEAIAALDGIDGHPPAIDVRRDGVTVRLLTSTPDYMGMTTGDLERARRISRLAAELGLDADPSAVQSVLVIIESLVPAEVMPFWRAVFGYVPRADSPDEDLVDPRDRGPSLWFETLGDARPRAGGIHLAVWVPREQAEVRLAAALAAGGRLVRDTFAPSWWTLADAAGNEVDIATTTGRD
jgi:4a-hydroxytetrahydrobiopterin dehydratase